MCSQGEFVITSLQNGKVKEAIKLRDRRGRDESDLFLIEGYRELKRAVEAGVKVATLFYCREFFLGENEMALIDAAKCETLACSEAVFAKLSYRDRPDGILAVAPQIHKKLSDLRLSALPFLLIAESIEKPGNLGTILRSSDAAGADAVIVSDPTTDIHNPNVVRASVGTLFTQPVIEASSEETFAFLKERGIAIVAATPHANMEFTEADFKVPLAIAMGTEQYGLSEMWMNKADIAVRIPMFGIADSLNVASATTLLLYEVVRQRKRPLL
jgi:TrmH family RNA methyltransferase